MPEPLVTVIIVAILLVLFNRFCVPAGATPAATARNERARWVVNVLVVAWLALWLLGIAPGPQTLHRFR